MVFILPPPSEVVLFLGIYSKALLASLESLSAVSHLCGLGQVTLLPRASAVLVVRRGNMFVPTPHNYLGTSAGQGIKNAYYRAWLEASVRLMIAVFTAVVNT